MVKLEFLHKYIAYRNKYQHNTRTIDIRNILALRGSNVRSRDFPFKTVAYYWVGFWFPSIEDIIYSYQHNYQMNTVQNFNPKFGKTIYLAFKPLFNIMKDIHDNPAKKRNWYNTLTVINDNVSKCIGYLSGRDIDIKIDTSQSGLIKAPKKINYSSFESREKFDISKLYASLPEDDELL